MSFEIRIGDIRGVLNICFPAASIEAVSGSFTRSWERTQREMTPAEQAALDENVGRVEVTLSAGIEASHRRRRLPAPPGRRHRRSRASGVEPIEVRVNGKTKFVGAPVASATRSHIRIEGPVRASRTHAA